MPSYGEMYGVTTSAYTLAWNLEKASGLITGKLYET
jgi:hypothetical protein